MFHAQGLSLMQLRRLDGAAKPNWHLPKLPHPPGPGVPRAVEAAGAEVPDAVMHSLRGLWGLGTKLALRLLCFMELLPSATTSESSDLL